MSSGCTRSQQNGLLTNLISSQSRDAYFDDSRCVWVLSRYVDVFAALVERKLVQSSPRGEQFPEMEDDSSRAEFFRSLKSDIGALQSGPDRHLLKTEACTVLQNLAGRESVDLLGDVALPWAVTVLMKMSKTPAELTAKVMRIAAALLYRKAFSLDLEECAKPAWLRVEGLRETSKGSERELDLLISRRELTISKAVFFAVTQSLTAYLAKSWLALLSHSDHVRLLAENPDSFRSAGAELLRYSGIVHSLYRKAEQPVTIGIAQIKEGDLVELKIDAANFDSDRFQNPDRLDISRSVKLQLSLGAGLHSCPGASLVRQAFSSVTPLILDARPKLAANQGIVWMGDSTLRWPLAVWVEWQPGRFASSFDS